MQIILSSFLIFSKEFFFSKKGKYINVFLMAWKEPRQIYYFLKIN